MWGFFIIIFKTNPPSLSCCESAISLADGQKSRVYCRKIAAIIAEGCRGWGGDIAWARCFSPNPSSCAGFTPRERASSGDTFDSGSHDVRWGARTPPGAAGTGLNETSLPLRRRYSFTAMGALVWFCQNHPGVSWQRAWCPPAPSWAKEVLCPLSPSRREHHLPSRCISALDKPKINVPNVLRRGFCIIPPGKDAQMPVRSAWRSRTPAQGDGGHRFCPSTGARGCYC